MTGPATAHKIPKISTLGARLLSAQPSLVTAGRTASRAAPPVYLAKEETVARKLEPLNDRIVVKAIEQEDQTKSGIFIPDSAKERPEEGNVIAVGPGRLNDEGTRIPMDVAVGDSAIYSKFAGTDFEEDGEEYLIMKEADVLAKIR